MPAPRISVVPLFLFLTSYLAAESLNLSLGKWRLDVGGFATGGYTWQGSDRNVDKVFTTNRLDLDLERPYSCGSLGFLAKFSLEPVMGSFGFPVLLQTGETGDGQTPLVDRQAPHPFYSELATMARWDVSSRQSLFTYWGLPGTPALGPEEFSESNPELPLGHHWLSSTEVSYGVGTVGWTGEEWTLEGSLFRGREPDQNKWDLEPAWLDSWSTRLTLRPTASWSAQVSFGKLNEPEQLSPGQDIDRLTASVSKIISAEQERTQKFILAWGRNWPQGVEATDAWVGEYTFESFDRNTFFTRAERLENDHLIVAGSPLAAPGGFRSFRHGPFTDPSGEIVPVRIFTIYKLTIGHVYDFAHWTYAKCGIGATANVHFLPEELDRFYGETPVSFLLFLRVKLGQPSYPDSKAQPYALQSI